MRERLHEYVHTACARSEWGARSQRPVDGRRVGGMVGRPGVGVERVGKMVALPAESFGVADASGDAARWSRLEVGI